MDTYTPIQYTWCISVIPAHRVKLVHRYQLSICRPNCSIFANRYVINLGRIVSSSCNFQRVKCKTVKPMVTVFEIKRDDLGGTAVWNWFRVRKVLGRVTRKRVPVCLDCLLCFTVLYWYLLDGVTEWRCWPRSPKLIMPRLHRQRH